MPQFAVQYTYGPDKAAVRDEYRPLHREWLGEEHRAGNVDLVGPYTDGTGALLVIRAADRDAAEALLANDPFMAHRAVDAVRIDEWKQVFGPFDA